MFQTVVVKRKLTRVRGDWANLYKVKLMDKDEEWRGFLPHTGPSSADPRGVRHALICV